MVWVEVRVNLKNIMPPLNSEGCDTCEAITPRKQFKSVSIREVSNGFIVEKGFQDKFIASSIEEVLEKVKEVLMEETKE